MIQLQDNGFNNKIDIEEKVKNTQSATIVINGKNNELIIANNVQLFGVFIEIRGDYCSIIIEENCLIIGELRCLYESTSIKIQNETTMMGSRIFMHESGKIIIGKDCMFSGDILIDVSDVHSVIDLKSGKRINPPANIVIGNHVWLCYGCTLLKGITIGDNAIVAAKSLVSKDVPANTMVGGIPAKIIKENVTWDRRLLPIT
jgi:acetyltransferase-like isoleucine patch superfamily enzyme